MNSDETKQYIEQAIEQHVRTTSEEEGLSQGMVTQWVVVAYVSKASNEDGEHSYFTVSSKGLPPHSKMGLHQLGIEYAGTLEDPEDADYE